MISERAVLLHLIKQRQLCVSQILRAKNDFAELLIRFDERVWYHQECDVLFIADL